MIMFDFKGFFKEDKMILKSKFKVLSLFLLFFSFVFVLVSNAEEKKKEEKPANAYIGIAKCKMCHKKKYDIWAATKHAKALESLKSEAAQKIQKDAQTNEKCVKCHTTGYGEKGGYAIPKKDDKTSAAAAVLMENNQCENCHGAGEKYSKFAVMKDQKAAIAAGLVVATEDTCKKCHNTDSPTFDKDKWDFKKAYELIKH